MKIYRNGQEIELTAEELRAAYEVKNMENLADDVKVEAYNMGIFINEEDACKIAQRFDDALSKNDDYMDYYWCILECVVKECIKEKSNL